MKKRYLLYIDILGFSDLVDRGPAKVDDVYEIVASLNAHHHSVFSVIAFSDTILVHNLIEPADEHDHQYIVMYQCEFARELLHRLADRAIFFRALLSYGEFEHYLLNSSSYYYGRALIESYRLEKELKITGLLMDEHCRAHSDIFQSKPFASNLHYVYLTQALNEYEDLYAGEVPLNLLLLDQTALPDMLGPELETLHNVAIGAVEQPDPDVRKKLVNTLEQYRARYPQVFESLERSTFAMESVNSNFDWSRVREAMRTSYALLSVRSYPRAGQP